MKQLLTCTIDDWFDIVGRGTALTLLVSKGDWEVGPDEWLAANTVRHNEGVYANLYRDPSPRFIGCLVPIPQNPAPFRILIEGHYPKGQFKRGDCVRIGQHGV